MTEQIIYTPEKIKALRDRLAKRFGKFSQQDLAERLRCSISAVKKWEYSEPGKPLNIISAIREKLDQIIEE